MICSSACSVLLDLGLVMPGLAMRSRSGANDITDLLGIVFDSSASMARKLDLRGRP